MDKVKRCTEIRFKGVSKVTPEQREKTVVTKDRRDEKEHTHREKKTAGTTGVNACGRQKKR